MAAYVCIFDIEMLCKHHFSQANAVKQHCCIAQQTVQCIHAAQSKHSDNLSCVKGTNVEPIALTAVTQVCLILLISVHGP